MEKIFAAWPQVSDMARELGRPYTTVKSWQDRGIPYRHMNECVKAARKRGADVTFEEVVMDRASGAAQ